MRRSVFISAFIVLIAAGCSTVIVPPQNIPTDMAREIVEEGVMQKTISVLPEHEKLTFRVKWIGILAGEIISEIKGISEIRGRKAYVIEVTARTIGFCSTLYRVEDHYTSYLDVEKLYSLRHEVHRREGGYVKDAVTDFDQENHKAYFKSMNDKTEKVFDIPPDVHDTVTAAYFARLLPLKEGRAYKIPVCNSEKNYDVFLSISSKETLSVPGHGRKEVFHIKPFAKWRGEEVREGRLSGFVGVEQGHLPLYIVIKAPVFTKVTATLLVDQKTEKSAGN